MYDFSDLQRWWNHTGSGIVTEVTPATRIATLERRYDIILPGDFRRYLSLSSPVGEAMDANFVTWWEFDRVRNIPDEYPHEVGSVISGQAGKHLFFADFCIWCWAWAISCADDESYGKIVLVAGVGHDRIVAESFSDFVERYLLNWHSIM